MIPSRLLKIFAPIVFLIILVGSYFLFIQTSDDQSHRDNEETLITISNLAKADLKIFKAGKNLAGASEIIITASALWLPPGNYFLSAATKQVTLYFPIVLSGFQSGPDEDGTFNITIRPFPKEYPPILSDDSPAFRYIPSGNFLLGDRQNPREPHHVWLTGYFIAEFEVTNKEFRAFLHDRNGYDDDANWSEQGLKWKKNNPSHATALLLESDGDYERFGRDALPVVWTTWFEANAYCKWLTKKIGNGRWLYALPTDAEWEKAARGPDNFDYALGMQISDEEIPHYNWKKNPDAVQPMFSLVESRAKFTPNRYGLYHMTGNASEWSQSVNKAFSRSQPYADDDHNLDRANGLRTIRGGSWYSASIAYLYIPYRDAFQPEHCNQESGFRVVAKLLP